MREYKDQDLVKNCLLKIEEKLGWGSSKHWHSEVFAELSDKIQGTTGVLLSPTTLKRVWGRVTYKNSPSITTLNALAQFAGSTNWRDFKQNTTISAPVAGGDTIHYDKSIIFLSTALIGMVLLVLFSMIGLEKNKATQSTTSDIKFSSRPIASGLPNSVVFDLDIANVEADSIHIQQYWDPSKTIKVSTSQKQATGIYYFPGYFRAKLLINGDIAKEHDLYIKSQGWIGTVDYSPIPKYVLEDKLMNERLAFPQSIEDEVRMSDVPLTTTFHFVEDFNKMSGDNITLKATIKNTHRDKWAVCQNLRIILLGTKGAVIIPFSIPGCVSDLGLMMNDVYVSGKEHDLSAFGIDLSDYREFEVNIEDQEIKVLVDHEHIYTGNYNESIGDFAGMRFRFLGLGEVAHLSISDIDSTNIFTQDFAAQ